MEWKIARRTLPIGPRPLVMGILNVTPDSFSDGGKFSQTDDAVEAALVMEADGADLIDIGGESTRPGAIPVPADEELARVLPVLRKLQNRLRIPLSIDTYKAAVARAALDLGVEIVNDISAGRWDRELWPTVAQARAGYVLMHAQARPAAMQQKPLYAEVVREVRDFLAEHFAAATHAGIAPESIVCDVGIGFGKTVEHNLALLRGLKTFTTLARPILIGVSRKSFLKKIAGEANLPLSTMAVQVWASAQGAQLWRTHDVAAAVAIAGLVEKLNEA